MALIWKKLEYEDDSVVLHEFFQQMILSSPTLLNWHSQLSRFCQSTYARN